MSRTLTIMAIFLLTFLNTNGQDTLDLRFRLGINAAIGTANPNSKTKSPGLFGNYKMHTVAVGPVFSQRLYNIGGFGYWYTSSYIYGFQLTGVNGVSFTYMVTPSNKDKFVKFIAGYHFEYIEFKDKESAGVQQLNFLTHTILSGITLMDAKKIQIQLVLGVGLMQRKETYHFWDETMTVTENSLTSSARLTIGYVIWRNELK